MSARFVLSDNLFRAASVPNYNAAYTVTFWGQLVTDRNATSTFCSVNRVAGGTDNYDALTTASDGTTMQINVTVAGGLSSSSGYALAVGRWYHFALVRESATAIKFYVDGVQRGSTLTTNVAARAASDKLAFGNYFTGTNSPLGSLDGRIAFVKLWTRVLNQGEIAQEVPFAMPVSRLSLFAWWPFHPNDVGATNRRDYSGNNANLTQGGGVSDNAESPPINFSSLRFNAFSHLPFLVAWALNRNILAGDVYV